MGEIAQAFVRIRPNMAGFEAETVGGVKKTFEKAAKVAGLAFGAAETFNFAKSAALDAAGVQKSQEVIRSEFGKSGEALTKFSETAGIKLGIASHESDAISARFGILFKNMGIGQQQAATMTLNMEKLAGSLAAIRGVDPSAVLDRLPIAMAGNVRGLKQLGIAIDANAIKQEALALGFGHVTDETGKNTIASNTLAIAKAKLSEAESKYASNSTQVASAQDAVIKAQEKVTAGVKETLGALDPAQRAQVIYAIATKNLGEYQQQAAAHAGDYINVQRRLSAEWDHAKETLGAALLPALTHAATELADYFDKLNRTGQLQRDVNAVIRNAGEVFRVIGGIVRVVADAFRKFADAVGGAANAAKVLIAAWAGFKAAQLAVALEGVTTKIAAMGAASATAAGEQGVGGLLGKLGALRSGVAAPFVIAIGLSYFIDKYGAKNVAQSFNPFGDGTLGPGVTPFPGGEKDSPFSTAYSRAAMAAYQKQYGTRGPGGAHGGGGHLYGSSLAGEDPTLAAGIEALAQAGYSVDVTSAKRSFQEQVKLYARYVKSGFNNKYIAAKPGTSDHERGEAADVLINGKPAASYGAAFLAQFGLGAPLGMRDAVHLTALGTSAQQGPGSAPPPPPPGTSLVVGTAAKSTAQQVASAKASIEQSMKGIVKSEADLGPAMTAEIRKHTAAVRAELTGISSPADVKKARANLSDLHGEVTDALKKLRTEIALNNTFGGLKTQVAKLGAETTPQIKQQMAEIRKEIGTVSTPQQIAEVRSQMTRVKNEVAAQLAALKARVQSERTGFDSAWNQLASGADAAFQRATEKALRSMQVLVTGAFSSFQFGGGVTQTPAEAALAQLQAAHDAAAAAAKLATDQATLADAQAGGDPAALLSAQQAVDDDLYTAKVAALQAQATLERNAATQQLQDAQTAYQDQRNLLQQQLDGRVAAIEQGMLNGSIAASAGMQMLTDVLGDPQYGIDMRNSGLVIGTELYNGLSDGLAPVFDLIRKLTDDMRSAGLLTGQPAAGGDLNGSLDPAVAAAIRQRGGQVPGVNYGSDLSTYQATQDEILRELRTQTDLAKQGTTVVVSDDKNANRVAFAAGR